MCVGGGTYSSLWVCVYVGVRGDFQASPSVTLHLDGMIWGSLSELGTC